MDGVNGDPQHPGYFYDPTGESEALPANLYTNLPLLGVDYLKEKIYEQINTNPDGFLATFDDDPMKSTLDDVINSPYFGEFAPADAAKIADFIKGVYKNARDTQYMKNRDDALLTQKDYQQLLLNDAQFLNDSVDFFRQSVKHFGGIWYSYCKICGFSSRFGNLSGIHRISCTSCYGILDRERLKKISQRGIRCLA